MQRMFSVFPMAALLGLALIQCSCAQKTTSADASKTDASRSDASKNVYIVTHIDVIPTFSDGAGKAIQKYAADSRNDKGAVSIEGLVQDGRPNHFTIVETWQNREAFGAHAGQDNS